MGASIVDIQKMGDALRNTGYKNIDSAVAEIIDNSIEANAKDVFLLLSETLNPRTGRKAVTQIGFLDNGEGMTDSILGTCLGIGATTRQGRKGMGRFGVGLPQASLYACPEVEVYSWQNGINNAKKVFLNIERVKDGTQKEIEEPMLTDLPEEYAVFTSYNTLEGHCDFLVHGTLVVWKNCDRISPKTINVLTERLRLSLGQKFRYFIHKGTCNIRIINIQNQDAMIKVAPNDPMFLMEDNYVLCAEDDVKHLFHPGSRDNLEPAFELYTAKGLGTGEEIIPIKYLTKNNEVKTENVTVRYSIVKDKFYDETAFPVNDPGKFEFGKYAKKLEGVSVIRADREIDFRQFDFYDATNQPQHRWWGCEILFDPVLDEAFGVANNKQYVELKRIEEGDIDIDEEVKPVWSQLESHIRPTIKNMYSENKEKRRNTRTPEDVLSPAATIITTVEKDDVDDDGPEVDPKIGHTQEEIEQEAIEALKEIGYSNPTDSEIRSFYDSNVYFDYSDRGERSPAFDYKNVFGTTIITINTGHKLYTSFLESVYSDKEAQTTFELFIAALVLSVQKVSSYSQENTAAMDNLLTTMYNRLNRYIQKQLNPEN